MFNYYPSVWLSTLRNGSPPALSKMVAKYEMVENILAVQVYIPHGNIHEINT